MAQLSSVPPQPLDLSSIIVSSEEVSLRGWAFTAYGHPGVGKTILALTASEKFPDDLPTKTPVTLDDIAIAEFDQGGLDALPSLGIRLPYVIDARKLLATKTVVEVNRLIVDAARSLVGKIKTFIIDPISTMDTALNAYMEGVDFRTERGKPDKFAMFRAMQREHYNFYKDLRDTGLNIIFLAHAKAVMEPMSDSPGLASKSTAQGLNAGDIVPSITGQKTSELYTASVTLCLPMLREKDPKTGVVTRIVAPHGSGSYQGKDRWEHLLSDREPAHLGKILKKVGAR